MLAELAVADLGVIDHLNLLFGPGMTALTGETGAGKTLVVEAIELLVGGRADAGLVRAGATECRVEGRFIVDDDELVLARVVPRDGRSRAYVNGRLATAAQLAELGGRLVDLHGQHAHQSLLAGAVQRAALDRYGNVELAPLQEARARVVELDAALAALGGDERARAREIDLLRYQVDELRRAALDDPDEDVVLEREEDLLADAQAHREAATAALTGLRDDGGALDLVGSVRAQLSGRGPFHAIEARLRALAAELDDVAGDLRSLLEDLSEDPERLAAVRARRQLLHELQRKYGEQLADVMAYRDEAAARLAELEGHDERAAALDRERAEAIAAEQAAAGVVAAARRAAAPDLAEAVTRHLAELAMPGARLDVDVSGPAGEAVTFLLAANAGEPAGPLARVASGGELARAMLALRLVLAPTDRSERDGEATGGVSTVVFDEVDAGIGGEAALTVGRALAAVGERSQVLVVTHLAQVAAFAHHQVAVTKDERAGRVAASATPLHAEARVVELSRMLSGLTGSDAGRVHAEELLAEAARSSAPSPRPSRSRRP